MEFCVWIHSVAYVRSYKQTCLSTCSSILVQSSIASQKMIQAANAFSYIYATVHHKLMMPILQHPCGFCAMGKGR